MRSGGLKKLCGRLMSGSPLENSLFEPLSSHVNNYVLLSSQVVQLTSTFELALRADSSSSPATDLKSRVAHRPLQRVVPSILKSEYSPTEGKNGAASVL